MLRFRLQILHRRNSAQSLGSQYDQRRHPLQPLQEAFQPRKAQGRNQRVRSDRYEHLHSGKGWIYTFFTTPLQGYKFYRYDISPIVDGKYCPEQSFDLGTKVDPLDVELKGGVSYVVYSICYGSPISSYVLTITEKDVSHNPEKPDNPGGDSQGNQSANCSCGCHKKGIVKFFFKIGLFFQKIFKKNQVCKCGIYHY